MRFYRDRLSSRKAAAGALLFADSLTILATVMFVTGVMAGPGSGWDCIFLGVWALIPRNVGRFLQWLQKPRNTAIVTGATIGFLVGMIVALLIGIELLEKTTYNPNGSLRYGPILVLLTWFIGFLLAFPNSYRIHDALIGGCIVLGLIENMPGAGLWIPLFVTGICFSATTRHLIYDVHGERGGTRLNLHNARTVALGAGLVSAVVFLALSGGISLVVATPEPAFFLPDDSIEYSPGTGSGEPISTSSMGPETAMSAVPRGGQRTIGFSDNVELSDLSTPLHDSRIVLRARRTRRSSYWKPDGGTLWKGTTLTQFNGETEEWTVDPAPDTYGWPRKGLIKLDAGDLMLPTVKLEVTVTWPVFKSLVAPYHAISIGDFARATPDFGYRTNSAKDIYPEQGLRQNDRYVVHFQPPPGNSPFPLREARRMTGVHHERATLRVPLAQEIGIDLYDYARQVFGSEVSIGGRVEALHRHFQNDFLYNNEDNWSREQGRLSVFLTERRTGDCVYFSTATALLLRAGGISTRLAHGFIGGEMDSSGHYAVLNRNAHTWVEVYLPAIGWYPLDTTQSAPKHPDFVPPNEPPVDPEALPDRVSSREFEESARQWEQARAEEARQANGTSSASRAERMTAPPIYQPQPDPSPPPPDPFAIQPQDDPTPDPNTSAPSEARPEMTAMGGGPDNATAVARAGTTGEAEPRTPVRDLLTRLGLILLAGVTLFLTTLSFLRPSREETEDNGGPENDALPPEIVATARSVLREPESADEAITFEYAELQQSLLQSRNHRRDHETPVEHGERYKERGARLESAFEILNERLYDALYGPQESSDDAVREFRRSCRTVRKHLR